MVDARYLFYPVSTLSQLFSCQTNGGSCITENSCTMFTLKKKKELRFPSLMIQHIQALKVYYMHRFQDYFSLFLSKTLQNHNTTLRIMLMQYLSKGTQEISI